jgi:hypothetical protein
VFAVPTFAVFYRGVVASVIPQQPENLPSVQFTFRAKGTDYLILANTMNLKGVTHFYARFKQVLISG